MKSGSQQISSTFVRHALTVLPGEVHAVLGHNGSGKSTLIKILAGVYQPESGCSATAHGEPLALGSATSARNAGLWFLHQDLGLIPNESIVDNMALTTSYVGRWWLSDRQERKAANDVLRAHGVPDDASALVSTLSPARQTMVAIARALRDDTDTSKVILVLDEPTAALPAHEVEHLFSLISALKERGGTVIYVSHRLGEILTIADRVTVLRDGRMVTTTEVAGLTEDDLVTMIVGQDVEAFYPPPPPVQREVILSVDRLRSAGLRDVSFELHRGVPL